MAASIIIFVYKVLIQLIRIYSFIWFIWIVLSWLNAFGVVQINQYNPIIRIFYNITDGVIDRIFGNFRYKFVVGMLDLSPLVFLILLTTVIPIILSAIVRMLLRILG